MRKMSALVEHIIAVTGIPREQVAAWADRCPIELIGRDLGYIREDGEKPRQHVELALLTYDAVIQIERYAGDGAAFAALVATWLNDCDPDRDNCGDPEITVTLNVQDVSGKSISDIDIAVEFEERLTAVENPDGDIPYNGKVWSLVPLCITPVEHLVAMRAVNAGAGKIPPETP